MEQPKRNTRLVGFESTIEFAEQIKQAAKAEHRSMASWMRHKLSEALR